MIKMRLKDGKTKVITLSYDDGVVQDIKLIEILDKYGLKGTFNINSGKYYTDRDFLENNDRRMTLAEARKLYIGSKHEIAVHTYDHAMLDVMTPEEALWQITEDRRKIEEEYGVIARGMAYPYGAKNEQIVEKLKNSGIVYSRTTNSTHMFDFPQNWLFLNPTCHHDDMANELIKEFVENDSWLGYAKMFYLWGHSYEFERNNNWTVIEEFAKYAGGRDDIWYATNIEIYDYVKAYESLHKSYDGKIVYNPSAMDVWLESAGEVICIKSGEKVELY